MTTKLDIKASQLQVGDMLWLEGADTPIEVVNVEYYGGSTDEYDVEFTYAENPITENVREMYRCNAIVTISAR